MKNSEKLAKALVELALPGATMRYRAAQSAQLAHDFDLEYPDGTVVSLEVTESTDSQYECTLAAIRSKRKGGSFVTAKKCHKDWMVHPASGANINRIRAQVDTYLAEIEATGCERFFAHTDAAESPLVFRIMQDLNVEAGEVVRWREPGRICIAPPSQGTVLNAGHVQRAVETEAHKCDNRRKLSAAAQSESHLFIFIRSENYPAWRAINAADPPCTIPALPKEVTHVWAAAATGTVGEFVVWRASSTEAWTCLDRFQLPDGQL